MSECTHDCSNCSEKGNCQEITVEKPNKLSSVRKVIGVVSGKGGVGKSLVSSLLASALQKSGYRTAVLDADLTGPSVPRMFGIDGRAEGCADGILPAISRSGVQIMSMMLPRIIAKYQTRNLSKMGKNPAQTSQQKQMKWISIFMMGFTIVMGFFLPSAMAIYWLIGGLISMAQTGITQLVIAKSKKKHNRSR